MPFETARSSTDSGIEIFTLSGTLTMGAQLQKLEWAIEDVSKKEQRKVVLDMSGVTYIDSSAVGVLVSSNGLMAKSGGELRLAGVSDRVLNILRLTGVDAILRIDSNLGASEAALIARSGQSS